MDGNHRHFDDVCRSTLDRRIDGIAFRERTHRGIVRIDVRQVPLAAEQSHGIAVFAGKLFLRLNEINDSRERSKIVVNQRFRLRTRAIKLL